MSRVPTSRASRTVVSIGAPRLSLTRFTQQLLAVLQLFAVLLSVTPRARAQAPAEGAEPKAAAANRSADAAETSAESVGPEAEEQAAESTESAYLEVDIADLLAEVARHEALGVAGAGGVSPRLKVMKTAARAFAKAASSYKKQTRQLVQREYQRYRLDIERKYASQIERTEKLQDAQRTEAIDRLQAFTRAYADDAKLTPDALFRLGELYFEESQIAFQAAFDSGDDQLTAPDYGPTVRIYFDLADRFPEYRRIDAVYYLIGYCLAEMGDAEAALAAWRHLVCANDFPDYRPKAKVETASDTTPETLGGRAGFQSATAEDEELFTAVDLKQVKNVYAACTPVSEGAQFQTETWFRIGEYHFDDYQDPSAIQLAIYAYEHILESPEDRNYNLALYKEAWAYYRSSRYPEAIRFFGALIDWSDEEQAKTGRAGSELRPEAVQYIALSLAYDDWNENQVADVLEGGPNALTRAQDAKILPQDRKWTPEVYFQLGQVLFDEVKYPQAIAVWEVALKRWPLHPMVPEFTNSIAIAYTRDNQMEAAIGWIARLSDYRQGSAWWNANLDRPGEQRRAEELAEGGLVNAALYYHQEAQQTRQRCVAEQDVALCDMAAERYRLASLAYGDYLKRFPNTPRSYELTYNLADTFYWSTNYERSAAVYGEVRDSNLDNRFLSESARLVVESQKRIVEKQQATGAYSVLAEPQGAVDEEGGVQVLTMPLPLIELVDARETYLKRVSYEDDTENVRDAYAFNNGLLFYFYGYWDHAKKRFEDLLELKCKGERADETGRVAWINLRNIAVNEGDRQRVGELGAYLEKESCTFGTADRGEAVNCALPENKENPYCIAGSDLVNIRYAKAVELFGEAEKTKDKKAQWSKYEQAAELLLNAVNEEPDHPEAPLALEKAALALERTERYESAANLYQRIIDEVGPLRATSPSQQERLDAILANAYFRLGVTSDRFLDFDRALASYKMLVDSERFKRSEASFVKERREDSVINTALLLERVQRYDDAERYYLLTQRMVTDPAVVRTAQFRRALMSVRQKDCAEARDRFEAFLSGQSAKDPAAAPLRVEAAWEIAACSRRLSSSSYEAALTRVVDVFKRSGLESGSVAAEFAARAQYTLAQRLAERSGAVQIRIAKPKTMESYVKALSTAIQAASQQTLDVRELYEPVATFGRARWTIASLVRSGEAYEALSRAVLNAPFLMPADLQKQLRRVTEDQREDIRIQVEDRIRMLLDEQVRPLECSAVESFALAARLGRIANLSTEETVRASDRLQAYGGERIAECIAARREQDESFKSYEEGEFDRAPAGLTREPTLGTGYSGDRN